MANSALPFFACFYKGKKTIIQAANSIAAQYAAIEHYQPTKRYMIAVKKATAEDVQAFLQATT